MITIEENKKGQCSTYHYIQKINDKILIDKVVKYPIAIVNGKGFSEFILYNDKYEVIEPFWRYVNIITKKEAYNTRSTKAYTLRLLFIYCDLFNVPIENITSTDLIKLSDFLQGTTLNREELTLSLLTKRSRNTVLMMINCYKKFCRYLHYNTIAFETTTRSQLINVTALTPTTRKNTKTGSFNHQEVPKYVSKEEFITLIKVIKASKVSKEIRLRNECMVRLMYEGGLRIGEVLGLTLEDIEYYQTSRGSEGGLIIIRNRLSNNKHQNAKGCMKVYHSNNYSSNEYKTFNVGYQLTYISIDTYDLINEYIDLVHGKGQLKRNKARYQNAKADAVGSYKQSNHTNYYLFLMPNYKPISSSTWNITIRKLYEAANIEVDYMKRENNLSHRLRHGFAMHLLYDLGYTIEFVKKRMRHRNISSTQIYYNPTSSQIIEMKEKFEDELSVMNEIEEGGINHV